MEAKDAGSDDKKVPLTDAELKTLLQFIETVKYGSVTLLIQDGIVIQIDKNEKLRLKR
jgi:hypothetical protein